MSALLRLRGLSVSLPGPRGPHRVVDRIDLELEAHRSLGVVGESGSGKTVTALAVLGLLPSTAEVHADEMTFEGRDLLRASPRERRRVCGGGIAMVFQDAGPALNPTLTVGRQVAEVFRFHEGQDRRAAWRSAITTLGEVGLADPERRARSYPHELSGGMQQRVLLAVALAGRPRVLIADEPTTALDVTTQAQILDLVRELQVRRDMALWWISHDLAVVGDLCDEVAVMYAGRIVEQAATRVLFAEPRHPYTRALMASQPALASPGQALRGIPGQVPDPAHLPAGCRFRPRCPHAEERCQDEPPWQHVTDHHRSACHFPNPGGDGP